MQEEIDRHLLSGLAPALLACLALATSAEAIAQGDTAEGSGLFDEITVTARKREETLTDVPLYINAMTADQLERAGVEDSQDFVGKVPGISKSGDFFSPGKEFMMMVIRGVGSNGGMEPAAPVFLDGTYMPRLGFDTSFLDVERVEILYGPQSTLFGRNTEAGAISIVSRRPSAEFRSRVQLEVDDFGGFGAKAFASGQIGENLYAGISVEGTMTDGWLDNIGATNALTIPPDNPVPLPGDPGVGLTTPLVDGSDPDSGSSIGGRLSLRWVPTDNFEAFMTVDSQRFEGTVGLPGVPRDCNCYELDVEGVFDGFSESSGAMLRLEFALGSDTALTSITAFRKLETSTPFDFDGGSSIGLDGGAPLDMTLGGGQNIPGVTNSLRGNWQDFQFEQEIFSQEVRLASTSDSAFQWLAGVYVFDESFYSDRNVDIVGANGFPFYLREQDVDADREGFAVFAQGSYDVSDAVQLTLGVRYSDEESDAASSLFWETPFFANYGNQINGGSHVTDFEFDEVNYTASIRWDLTENLTTFFTTGTAFKSGGYALGPTGTLPADEPYLPETATSYELGFKGSFLDDRMRANLSFFSIDLEDQQVRTTKQVGNLIFGATANAAEATSEGINFDLQWYATDNLLLSANYGYTDAKFDEFVTANGLDFSGERVRFVPETTVALGADWTLPISGNLIEETTLYARWTSVGDQVQGFDNIAVDVEFAIDSYDTLDLGARFRLSDRTDATLFVNNATDEYIQTRHWNVFFFAGPGGSNRVMSTTAPPRNIGLKVSVEF